MAYATAAGIVGLEALYSGFGDRYTKVKGGVSDRRYGGKREALTGREAQDLKADVQSIYGEKYGSGFGKYGGLHSAGKGRVRHEVWDKDIFSSDDLERVYYRESDVALAVSGDVDELYEVFSSRFDIDLAFQAVGGVETHTMRNTFGSGSQTILERRGKDMRTYQLLMQSERRRRKVFGETFFA